MGVRAVGQVFFSFWRLSTKRCSASGSTPSMRTWHSSSELLWKEMHVLPSATVLVSTR